ncbi:unnamed protein product [Bemisia tabaci]|uniref:Beta-catenin-interacting ICAT domain-containing protein n=1 Tax=Bemisia tabaci TaxID=7038 RepID=A0A9P0A1W4_BEMTA|nr:unnamed protein product [Bemisia tabaci]
MSKSITNDEKLKQNLKDQLSRLMNELVDLDECKDDFEEEEYNQARVDVLEQIREFEERLKKIVAGNLSVIDDLTAVLLATRAAVGQSFKTPTVIKMFAGREVEQLRARLVAIERDLKLDASSFEKKKQEKVEILSALQALKVPLSQQELGFLKEHSKLDGFAGSGCEFVQASQKIVGEKAVSLAAHEIQNSMKS